MSRGSSVRRLATWCAALALAVGVLVPISQTVATQPAAAFSGSDFDPGYIISDDLFYDGGAMSSADIQNFLQSQVGACGNANCLRNAIVSPPSYGAISSPSTGAPICSTITGGSMPVSEWIYRVQTACGISAKVILVTLQKEQGLVTASAPSDAALRAAMGMACPDTAPCDSAFAGLATQIYTGARQLVTYKASRVGKLPGANYIGYSPNAACGGTTISIRDWGTAALYTYTPYQPNAAALANLYGAGDGCSSYGNRNFWRYYWTWFGDPKGGDPAWVEGAFQDLLGHTSGTAATTWQNTALISGWSRADVAGTIFQSTEYRIDGITRAYEQILGRQPDAAGLNYWLGQTAPGTGLVSQVAGQFIMSTELYQRAGNTPEGWVSLAYETVLGRAPDPSGLVAWSGLVRSSGVGVVFNSIYNSPESIARRINLIYQTYLGHSADANAIAYFTPTILGAGDEGVAVQIIGSTEYSLRASLRFPGGSSAGALNPPANQSPPIVTTTATVSTSDPPFIEALSRDVLGVPADGTTRSSWNPVLAAGLSHTWLAASVMQSSAYRSKVVSAAYQTVLGRAADPDGLSYWVGQTGPGGPTLPSEVVTVLLASDEFVLHSGGTTPSWVAGVSRVLLGRAPTGAEASTWTNLAAASGRAAMISSIYSSNESVTRRLTALTQSLLGRAPTAADDSQYRAALAANGDEYVAAQIIGTPGYDSRAQTRFVSPFLRAIGTDLYGTTPSAGYFAYWSSLLATGTTHYALAALLYGSPEHRTFEITKAYESLLGREPDTAGLNYWLSVTAPGGSVRASTMPEQFLLSDELYIRAGNTPEGWVSMLFKTVLGRSPDPSGLAYWASQVRTQGRASVMWGIYNSFESTVIRLNAMTTQLLGRPVTNADISGLGPLMVSGGEEAVGPAIIGSLDYDTRSAARFPSLSPAGASG